MGMATLTDRAAAARGHSLKLYPEQNRSIVHRSVIQLDWEWLLTHVASNVDACQELARSVATTLHNRDAKLFTIQFRGYPAANVVIQLRQSHHEPQSKI